MRSSTPVAIVGAGPYGLSVAAHLAGAGLRPRIFGDAMQTWRSFMPNGMVLKSEGFAMNLSDPSGSYTLEAHCRDQSIPYQATGWPVPVEVFAGYGETFQKRFVPQLEETEVRHIARGDHGLALTLATGETVEARHVVLATGIRPYARTSPQLLSDLPSDRVTHSGDQGDMERFRGCKVAVIGGGASAMDAAAALHRSGATAVAITHRPEVRFYAPNGFRDRFLAPLTPLGPGWKKQLCCKWPDLFHALPQRVRLDIVARYLGPSPAWSVRDIVRDHVDLRLSTHLTRAEVTGDQVTLTMNAASGGTTTLAVDHVIAATGYDVDIDRLTLLDASLRADLQQDGKSLRLNSAFETRVKGLHVVGTPAAASFGPMLRFVCGSAFAARRTAGEICRREGAQRMPATQALTRGAMPLSEA
ncbi:FAD-dependent oxidoreductase [Lichenifustis flavocetrariae]|uniref:NAD(P)-binding domain-containing protein n=1 Tax=Lichenifustis flavocetrariae TaxID=2949735 RepID=A0AA41YZV9_9HYPH|nr:FAD-dependent oxidoreductase [Lichenifustis flavocetrariae]MCW6511631.1 NAD(P)-binding domain-containing protein [Lichenifustis flavocetrariae]